MVGGGWSVEGGWSWRVVVGGWSRSAATVGRKTKKAAGTDPGGLGADFDVCYIVNPRGREERVVVATAFDVPNQVPYGVTVLDGTDPDGIWVHMADAETFQGRATPCRSPWRLVSIGVWSIVGVLCLVG
jgi:hypothetical protein